MTRPIMHSHLTEQVSMRPSLEQRPEMCWPVMASRCARCGDRAHPPRDILAAHEAKHLDHLVSRSSYRVKLLFQLSKRVPAKSFSVGLAWRRAAWMACADKAHPFDGDGGAEACSSTPHTGSQHIDPGRPPAAAGGLVSHRCQTSFLAPSAAADSGELQQAGRRDTTRSFGT